ncbi:hypothetical protein PGT21_035553 [Puccinia graminis f. sp. tritici]|uniref:Uncharacterized protein n=1 Tax=Puccinia graminis f. sp. tritici TaxID=56615 RepID=A0A5B0P0Q9_PUCGR|nr:hypothetical protein PGT21_035553 [Puccinia graminis f. sp. tritici]KAA1121364.1 hypothetical protein PGTUg99_015762 [Puccinia graminis f. sp. tritici]
MFPKDDGPDLVNTANQLLHSGNHQEVPITLPTGWRTQDAPKVISHIPRIHYGGTFKVWFRKKGRNKLRKQLAKVLIRNSTGFYAGSCKDW